MPTLREILAGYGALNAWEGEEERRLLPALTIPESVRQYLEMWDLAQCIASGAEEAFWGERCAHYEALHTAFERAARVMGRVQ